MEVTHSPGHPDLSAVGSPRTKASTSANHEVSRKQKSTDIATSKHATGGGKAKRRLSIRKQEGECDVAIYIFREARKHLMS